MAIFPNNSQMPKGSYPRNAHPVFSLVGTLVDVIADGISKINKVSFSVINKMNKVLSSKFNKISKAQN